MIEIFKNLNTIKTPTLASSNLSKLDSNSSSTTRISLGLTREDKGAGLIKKEITNITTLARTARDILTIPTSPIRVNILRRNSSKVSLAALQMLLIGRSKPVHSVKGGRRRQTRASMTFGRNLRKKDRVGRMSMNNSIKISRVNMVSIR
jgi:hypothetical protein